jgi:RimJ/RimL family protein N-acetyltransferase
MSRRAAVASVARPSVRRSAAILAWVQRPKTPPDPPLSDGVVTLRPWNERDIPTLVRLCNGDPSLVRWLRLPDPYSEHDARGYVEASARGWHGDALETPFAVVDADTYDVLGACGVIWTDPDQGLADVGYWTARDARGRGVATRAVQLLAHWVLAELGFERLQLQADTRNTASIRVAEKAGFTKQGVIRPERVNPNDPGGFDHALYSILRDEIQRPPPARSR